MAEQTLGDFHYLGEENNIALRVARSQFLDAIRRLAPEVLVGLASCPMALFLNMLNKARALDQKGSSNDNLEIAQFAVFADLELLTEEAIQAFVVGLREWSVGYHLDTDWMRDEALNTLREWSQLPPSERTEWAEPTWIVTHSSADRVHDFSFSLGRWNPEILRWQEYQKQAREAFEQALLNYRRNMEQLSRELGLTKARHTRNTWHFEALVRFQVSGTTRVDLTWSRKRSPAERLVLRVKTERRTTACGRADSAKSRSLAS